MHAKNKARVIDARTNRARDIYKNKERAQIQINARKNSTFTSLNECVAAMRDKTELLLAQMNEYSSSRAIIQQSTSNEI